MGERRINEYDLLKVICVVLVIIGHIFNLYHIGGAVLVCEEPTFMPIRNFIYSFHMPVFIAISGAIYQIQKSKGKYQDNSAFIKNKFKRLIIPYFLFALCFVFPTMCYVWNIERPINYLVENYLLAKDPRHLWFLLMLFYVFVAFNPVERYVRNHKIILLLFLLVCSRYISNWIPNIFCLNLFLKYAIWFYLGYLFEMYKKQVFTIISKLWVVFMLYAIIAYLYSFDKVTINAPVCFCLLYFLCHKLKVCMGEKSKVGIKRMVDLSMGIYLFHPVVLYISASFLNKQQLPSCISAIVLFLLGIFFSALFTVCLKKMKLGFLIGE